MIINHTDFVFAEIKKKRSHCIKCANLSTRFILVKTAIFKKLDASVWMTNLQGAQPLNDGIVRSSFYPSISFNLGLCSINALYSV